MVENKLNNMYNGYALVRQMQGNDEPFVMYFTQGDKPTYDSYVRGDVFDRQVLLSDWFKEPKSKEGLEFVVMNSYNFDVDYD